MNSHAKQGKLSHHSLKKSQFLKSRAVCCVPKWKAVNKQGLRKEGNQLNERALEKQG